MSHRAFGIDLETLTGPCKIPAEWPRDKLDRIAAALWLPTESVMSAQFDEASASGNVTLAGKLYTITCDFAVSGEP